MIKKVEIKLSKLKLLTRFCLCLLFPTLSLILFWEGQISDLFSMSVAIITSVFFISIAYYLILMMFQKDKGLIIDSDGIYNNSNWTSIGLIPWQSITHLETHQVSQTKFIMVHTSNQGVLLSKTSWIKRTLLSINSKVYGTPFSVISGTLSCNFNYLEKQLLSSFEEFKEQ